MGKGLEWARGWRMRMSRLRHPRRADARTEDRKNKNKCYILTE